MAKRDYYEMLGTERNALADEIKKAYHKKTIQLYPDKNPGDEQAEENLKGVAEVYDVLGDPQKHQRHDQFDHAGVGGASQGGGFDGGMSMEDIFSQFSDTFSRHFGGFDGLGGFGGSRGGCCVNRGLDLRMKVKLNLREVADGVEKKIKVKKHVPCSHCHGSGVEGSESMKTCDTCKGSGVATHIANTILGQMQTQTTCPTYDGEGRIVVKKYTERSGEDVVRDDEIIAINIPAGVTEGMQLSMNGKSGAARHGRTNGDLLILIEKEPRPELIHGENDLLYNLPLSVPQAALGTAVEVPTIDGKAKSKIEPGTQPGKVFRLCNKGLPSTDSYDTGDLLVNAGVYTPETLSFTEKEMLSRLENSPNFQPNKTMKEKIPGKFRHLLD